MTSGTTGGPLERLAEARGVAVSYVDAFSRSRRVSPDTLVWVLAALGEPIAHPREAAECLAGHGASPSPPPVVVAWEGALDPVARAAGSDDSATGGVSGSVPPSQARTPAGAELLLEDGSDATELLQTGTSQVPAQLTGARLPFGCHTLRLPGTEVLVVSAPRRVRPLVHRSWGVFAPTYALRDARRLAIGDLTCLGRLGRLAARLGASYLATLPLLADYAADDLLAGQGAGGSLSPYSPLSRMWWNEAYLDVARVPELRDESGPGIEDLDRRRPATPSERVDLAAAAERVQSCLRRHSARLAATSAARRSALEQFRRERPDVMRYAAFRAAVEERGTDRARWPARWAAGSLVPGVDVSAAAVERHVAAQWLTDTQVADVAASAASAGCHLMLDLPIGCRPDGYDTWAFPGSFAGSGGQAPGSQTPTGGVSVGVDRGVSVGAPPDAFFGDGQNWGFPPLHPEGERRSGYPVVRGSLAHLLRHAGALRIDHVLGFQRLWWIPAGAAAGEGTYVSYPSEELFALACLEAWRRDATLVGEDLGTVDPAVRGLLADHGIAGMQVAVFDYEGLDAVAGRDRPGAVAVVDTHDTATFAGWLAAADVDQRERLGILSDESAAVARTARRTATRALLGRLVATGRLAPEETGDARAVHAAVLEELGASEAGAVIATLEDLWAELDPQNLPGTTTEHANFCRTMARSLGELEASDDLLEPLRRLEQARHRDVADEPPPQGHPLGDTARHETGKVGA